MIKKIASIASALILLVGSQMALTPKYALAQAERPALEERINAPESPSLEINPNDLTVYEVCAGSTQGIPDKQVIPGYFTITNTGDSGSDIAENVALAYSMVQSSGNIEHFLLPVYDATGQLSTYEWDPSTPLTDSLLLAPTLVGQDSIAYAIEAHLYSPLVSRVDQDKLLMEAYIGGELTSAKAHFTIGYDCAGPTAVTVTDLNANWKLDGTTDVSWIEWSPLNLGYFVLKCPEEGEFDPSACEQVSDFIFGLGGFPQDYLWTDQNPSPMNESRYFLKTWPVPDFIGPAAEYSETMQVYLPILIR